MPESCNNCGKTSLGRFCQHCGSRLSDEATSAAPGGPDYGRLAGALGLGILALLFGGFGLCSFLFSQGEHELGPILIVMGLVGLGLGFGCLVGISKILSKQPPKG